MRKNSKGFTMIELLAAIVILGILIGVTVPIITSLLDTSRNKMYINDAKKLVTQVEYKLRAKSSSIEKPNEGDCIVVSMKYLDTSEFNTSPNGGKYEEENSFVIVKNVRGKLEYAVTIVEAFEDGGYKGVDLVTEDKLSSNNYLDYVVSFNSIINVKDISKNYINGKLGSDYISSQNEISVIYNDIE